MKYIVSDKYKFIYFVNQKVACSSIKEALLPFFDIDPGPYSFINLKGVHRLRPHQAFNESEFQITKKNFLQSLNEGQFEDYFKFGFARNPWDRLLSCYTQKIGKRRKGEKGGAPLQQPKNNPNAFRMDMSFDEFVETVHGIPDSEADPHFQSQHKIFFKRKTQGLLADFIGSFENLSSDFEYSMKKIGLDDKAYLPHVLKSRNSKKYPYINFYNETTKRLVAERFSADIKAFGYIFDE